MNERVKKYLEDIKVSIQTIDSFLGGKRDFNDLKGNKLLKRAIEREFEIIGEAMNNIYKLAPHIEITHPKKIIGLRNLIIHAYDAVMDEILWGIIVNHLPTLDKEVNELLQDPK